MPIIKFVNESEKIEYSTEQDVCSLLCYAFDPQKTIMNDNQFVGCKPFGFPFWYMRNPLAVHQFMEFNHKRQFKHWKDLAKHRVISFSKEENSLVATLKIIAERIVSFYANNGYIAAYAIHFGTENPHIHVIVDTISYQNLNKFDHCFIFQGQFCHFCSIHRDREVEDNLPNPVAIRLLFRE